MFFFSFSICAANNSNITTDVDIGLGFIASMEKDIKFKFAISIVYMTIGSKAVLYVKIFPSSSDLTGNNKQILQSYIRRNCKAFFRKKRLKIPQEINFEYAETPDSKLFFDSFKKAADNIFPLSGLSREKWDLLTKEGDSIPLDKLTYAIATLIYDEEFRSDFLNEDCFEAYDLLNTQFSIIGPKINKSRNEFQIDLSNFIVTADKVKSVDLPGDEAIYNIHSWSRLRKLIDKGLRVIKSCDDFANLTNSYERKLNKISLSASRMSEVISVLDDTIYRLIFFKRLNNVPDLRQDCSMIKQSCAALTDNTQKSRETCQEIRQCIEKNVASLEELLYKIEQNLQVPAVIVPQEKVAKPRMESHSDESLWTPNTTSTALECKQEAEKKLRAEEEKALKKHLKIIRNSGKNEEKDSIIISADLEYVYIDADGNEEKFTARPYLREVDFSVFLPSSVSVTQTMLDFLETAQRFKVLPHNSLGQNGIKPYSLDLLIVKCKKHGKQHLTFVAHKLIGQPGYVYLPYEIINHTFYERLINEEGLLEKYANRCRQEVRVRKN
jgi:hypothetical protein